VGASAGGRSALPLADCCERAVDLVWLRNDDFAEPLDEPDRADAARAGPLCRRRARGPRRQSPASRSVGLQESPVACRASSAQDARENPGSLEGSHAGRSRWLRFAALEPLAQQRHPVLAGRRRRSMLVSRVPKSGPGRIRTYDQGIHSAPMFPPGVDYLFTRVMTTGGCGMLAACHEGHLGRRSRASATSPQVVSAPSAGVPAARLRIAMSTGGSKVPLNSSRPLRAFPREGTCCR